MAPLFTGLRLGFGRVDAGPSGPPPISATGGAIAYSGDKTIHIFTSTTPLVVTSGTGTIDYLVVAGGGGSGDDNSGGGGAGGMLTGTATLVPGTYTVTVGGWWCWI
jgi:hypothetical protein